MLSELSCALQITHPISCYHSLTMFINIQEDHIKGVLSSWDLKRSNHQRGILAAVSLRSQQPRGRMERLGVRTQVQVGLQSPSHVPGILYDEAPCLCGSASLLPPLHS
jgi:hypothetical protein